MQQPIFGSGSFDSLQYHVFCETCFFSFRLQRTPSIEHSSVWIHDTQTRELVNTNARLIQSDASFLDVANASMSMTAPEGTGHIAVRDALGNTIIEVALEPKTEIVWDFPTGDTDASTRPVIHQPDIACQVTFRGKTQRGLGYCKRAYMEPPRYMGYVFIHGVSDDEQHIVWTADAGWGDSKYDYFKLLHGDGTLEESASTDSYQQWDAAYATLGDRRVAVHIEELGRWETSLVSGRMDSLYGQRYCRLKVEDGEHSFTGKALKEYWTGTVG